MNAPVDFSAFSHYQTVYACFAAKPEAANIVREAITATGLPFSELNTGHWFWRRTRFLTECAFDDLSRLNQAVNGFANDGAV